MHFFVYFNIEIKTKSKQNSLANEESNLKNEMNT